MLTFGGQALSLTDLTFDLHIDNQRGVIHVAVFDPSFAAMPADARGRVGFLALDWALGEDGVTRWIGRVTTSQTRPSAGVPADGLIEAVEALAGRAGADQWALLQGQRDGAVVIALLAISTK